MLRKVNIPLQGHHHQVAKTFQGVIQLQRLHHCPSVGTHVPGGSNAAKAVLEPLLADLVETRGQRGGVGVEDWWARNSNSKLPLREITFNTEVKKV